MIRKSSFFAIALSFAFASSADQAPVTYVDSNGVSQVCNSYTVVDENTTVWSNSWYLVAGEVSIDGGVLVSNDVHVILADGSSLEVDATGSEMAGIEVESGFSLSVYGQVNGSGALSASGDKYCAGIGSHNSSATNRIGGATSGTIVINGGVIDANGGASAAGIGGGFGCDGGIVTVNGGEVVATGGIKGAGIGGGSDGSGGYVTINGGLVIARGGEDADHYVGSGIGAGVKLEEEVGGGWIQLPVNNRTLFIGANVVVKTMDSSSQSYIELEANAYGYVDLGESNDYSELLIGATVFEDGYYLVGVFDGVDLRNSIDATRRLRENPNTNGLYRIVWTLGEGDSFEVVKIQNYRVVTRYGTNGVAGAAYVVPAEESGIRVLSFDPEGGSGGLCGCLGTAELPVVTYVDADGLTQTCSDYQFVSADMRNLTTGWYVLDSSNVCIDVGIIVSGYVNLILMDGKSLTVEGDSFDYVDDEGFEYKSGEAGICVEYGDSLAIYGQAGGTGKMTAKGGDFSAGIGSRDSILSGYSPCGFIMINGGVVKATGGDAGAGIGGGFGCDGGTVVVNRGTVDAVGGVFPDSEDNAAGIGAGLPDGEEPCNPGELFVAENMMVKAGDEEGQLSELQKDAFGSVTLTEAMYYVIQASDDVPPSDWPDVSGLSASDLAGAVISDIPPAFQGANAISLVSWANGAGGVAYEDRTGMILDAYLLNCTNTAEAVAAEKPYFRITKFQVGANGAVQIETTTTNSSGRAYNGSVTVEGSAAPIGPWATTNATHRFFRALLAL